MNIDGGSNLEIWSRTKKIPGVIDEESTIQQSEEGTEASKAIETIREICKYPQPVVVGSVFSQSQGPDSDSLDSSQTSYYSQSEQYYKPKPRKLSEKYEYDSTQSGKKGKGGKRRTKKRSQKKKKKTRRRKNRRSRSIP
jgi:hypothetical protein